MEILIPRARIIEDLTLMSSISGDLEGKQRVYS